ncbi:MAG: hypothetical protein D6710_02165 [Nitrospirae bacterium]|nr:MAG: hypothetical protein D6710_02165 [Nitrospirota bacterium]
MIKKTIIVIVLIISTASASFAWHRGNSVTPFGDYCPRASRYGMHSHNISIHDAEHALSEYYREKGYSIEVIKVTDRFIKINVLKGKVVVDIVIFDRRTGRLRSIY